MQGWSNGRFMIVTQGKALRDEISGRKVYMLRGTAFKTITKSAHVYSGK